MAARQSRALPRPLRVGLAGLAALYWPMTLAEGLRRRRDATLEAFATLGVADAEIAAHLGMGPGEYAGRYGLRQYDRLDDMMAAEQLDAVALCTRHTQHARWVERLEPHGADLFIFKTFATTMEQAERMCAVERRSRARIAVGPSARYLPWFVAAKRALDAGSIGTPFSMRVSHHHGTIDVFGPRDFYRDPREGGPELSLGWYLVDLVLHLMGREVTNVAASYGTFTSPGSPFMDCGKMILGLEGGAMASCDMYFCNRFAFPQWETEIVGDRGALLVRPVPGDPAGARVEIRAPGGCRTLPLPSRTPHWELFWIDEFRRAGAPSLTAAYAREVTRVCLAAREAARRGKTVPIR